MAIVQVFVPLRDGRHAKTVWCKWRRSFQLHPSNTRLLTTKGWTTTCSTKCQVKLVVKLVVVYFLQRHLARRLHVQRVSGEDLIHDLQSPSCWLICTHTTLNMLGNTPCYGFAFALETAN